MCTLARTTRWPRASRRPLALLLLLLLLLVPRTSTPYASKAQATRRSRPTSSWRAWRNSSTQPACAPSTRCSSTICCSLQNHRQRTYLSLCALSHSHSFIVRCGTPYRWEWDDLQAAYGARPNSLILDENALRLTIAPTTEGAPPLVLFNNAADNACVTVVNTAQTLAKGTATNLVVRTHRATRSAAAFHPDIGPLAASEGRLSPRLECASSVGCHRRHIAQLVVRRGCARSRAALHVCRQLHAGTTRHLGQVHVALSLVRHQLFPCWTTRCVPPRNKHPLPLYPPAHARHSHSPPRVCHILPLVQSPNLCYCFCRLSHMCPPHALGLRAPSRITVTIVRSVVRALHHQVAAASLHHELHPSREQQSVRRVHPSIPRRRIQASFDRQPQRRTERYRCRLCRTSLSLSLSHYLVRSTLTRA